MCRLQVQLLQRVLQAVPPLGHAPRHTRAHPAHTQLQAPGEGGDGPAHTHTYTHTHTHTHTHTYTQTHTHTYIHKHTHIHTLTSTHTHTHTHTHTYNESVCVCVSSPLLSCAVLSCGPWCWPCFTRVCVAALAQLQRAQTTFRHHLAALGSEGAPRSAAG